jgi:hypothetical protein
VFNYSKSAETALSLIKQFGKSYPIKRSIKTPDGITGAVTSVDTTGAIDAVILPVNTSKEKFDNQELTEAVAKGKARFLLVAASGAPFQPDAGDEVTIDSELWRCAGCTALSPAGVPVIYNIGVIRK